MNKKRPTTHAMHNGAVKSQIKMNLIIINFSTLTLISNNCPTMHSVDRSQCICPNYYRIK